MMRTKIAAVAALFLLFTAEAHAKAVAAISVAVPISNEQCHANCTNDRTTELAACQSDYDACFYAYEGNDPDGINCLNDSVDCNKAAFDKELLCDNKCDYGAPF